jgi:hypothetical protein
VVWLPPTEPVELDERELPPWLVFTADDEESHRDAWWVNRYRWVARFPGDDAALSRIAWANKPVFIYKRVAD